MFDCVMPTRAGRHGLAYTRRGKVNLRNARHADDPRPLDEESDCPAARDYSRAYLHHLVKSQEALGAMLLTWNNVAYYQRLMQDMRDAIEAGTFRPSAPPRSAKAGRGAICRRCEQRSASSLGIRPAGDVAEAQVLSEFEARRLTPVMRYMPSGCSSSV